MCCGFNQCCAVKMLSVRSSIMPIDTMWLLPPSSSDSGKIFQIVQKMEEKEKEKRGGRVHAQRWMPWLTRPFCCGVFDTYSQCLLHEGANGGSASDGAHDGPSCTSGTERALKYGSFCAGRMKEGRAPSSITSAMHSLCGDMLNPEISI